MIGSGKIKSIRENGYAANFCKCFSLCWRRGWFVAGPALAQTKPAVTSLGPDFPKTGIFIGNSFFYYNNGLPGHLSLLEKAADPANKQDYRNTMVTIGGSGSRLA